MRTSSTAPGAGSGALGALPSALLSGLPSLLLLLLLLPGQHVQQGERRRRQKTSAPTAASSASPPTTPPTIAPVVEPEEEEAVDSPPPAPLAAAVTLAVAPGKPLLASMPLKVLAKAAVAVEAARLATEPPRGTVT